MALKHSLTGFSGYQVEASIFLLTSAIACGDKCRSQGTAVKPWMCFTMSRTMVPLTPRSSDWPFTMRVLPSTDLFIPAGPIFFPDLAAQDLADGRFGKSSGKLHALELFVSSQMLLSH